VFVGSPMWGVRRRAYVLCCAVRRFGLLAVSLTCPCGVPFLWVSSVLDLPRRFVCVSKDAQGMAARDERPFQAVALLRGVRVNRTRVSYDLG